MSIRNTTPIALSGPTALVPAGAAFSMSDLAFCGISVQWNPSSGSPTITMNYSLGTATLDTSNQETAFAPGTTAQCTLQSSIANGTWSFQSPWGSQSGTLTTTQIQTLTTFAANIFNTSASGAESTLQSIVIPSSALSARATGYVQP